MNSTSPTNPATRASVPTLFADPDFQVAGRSALGKSAQGAIDLGLTFLTLSRITDGDPSSWYQEWRDLADNQRSRAEQAHDDGHFQTAGAHFLAASDAYSRALAFVDGMPDDGVLGPTFRAGRDSWDAFIASTRGRHVAVAVPYEGGTLPGYLLRPDATGAPRPTMVVANGSDGSLPGLWAEGIRSGLERGWNVFVFDGPGQQSMLFERGVPFRPDWEKVLTPVVDSLVARDDVDGESLLAYAISQGGYWLGRALAFEHRFVAAALDGGVVDVSRTWNANLPPEMLALLHGGQKETFDQYMGQGPSDPALERQFAFRARPYGAFDSAFDLFTAVGTYTLGADLVAQITTPTLVTDPDDEDFFPGQSREMYDLLRAPKQLARFTREDGAEHHCQPLGRTLTGLTVNDFFADHLATSPHVV
ncbi:alpha/beta hydrolase family protein [Pengzhenrongella frigida]|uniref:Dipeptidyl aminopeptidase n=1 Tax=Pengzhenrongella frigida TaxID=1259133 RepID=A0A4V1ZH92_9MICO|nr:dipeptidyl aminopeptidase [Cellulomonas sp. HLT2-17]RYV51234.1 dipeptidyl aminopeptidase [Cellulomonas sp. HLT2-17]